LWDPGRSTKIRAEKKGQQPNVVRERGIMTEGGDGPIPTRKGHRKLLIGGSLRQKVRGKRKVQDTGVGPRGEEKENSKIEK